jgi:hypothetical protein
MPTELQAIAVLGGRPRRLRLLLAPAQQVVLEACRRQAELEARDQASARRVVTPVSGEKRELAEALRGQQAMPQSRALVAANSEHSKTATT